MTWGDGAWLTTSAEAGELGEARAGKGWGEEAFAQGARNEGGSAPGGEQEEEAGKVRAAGRGRTNLGGSLNPGRLGWSR